MHLVEAARIERASEATLLTVPIHTLALYAVAALHSILGRVMLLRARLSTCRAPSTHVRFLRCDAFGGRHEGRATEVADYDVVVCGCSFWAVGSVPKL